MTSVSDHQHPHPNLAGFSRHLKSCLLLFDVFLNLPLQPVKLASYGRKLFNSCARISADKRARAPRRASPPRGERAPCSCHRCRRPPSGKQQSTRTGLGTFPACTTPPRCLAMRRRWPLAPLSAERKAAERAPEGVSHRVGAGHRRRRPPSGKQQSANRRGRCGQRA
jgi:hypothetical protein